jgi:hypothetical protein
VKEMLIAVDEENPGNKIVDAAILVVRWTSAPIALQYAVPIKQANAITKALLARDTASSVKRLAENEPLHQWIGIMRRCKNGVKTGGRAKITVTE